MQNGFARTTRATGLWLACLVLSSLPLVGTLGCSPASPTGNAETTTGKLDGLIAPASDVVDLGESGQGASVERPVVLVSHRSDSVNVSEIKVSCECLSVELPKRTFAPREPVNAKLRLDLQKEPDFVGSLRIEVQGFSDSGIEVMRFHVATRVRPHDDRSSAPDKADPSNQ